MTGVATAAVAAADRDGALDEALALLDAAYRRAQHSHPHDAFTLAMLHTIDCAREMLSLSRGAGTASPESALRHGRAALYTAGYGAATAGTASSSP